MLLYDRIVDANIIIDHALTAETRGDICMDAYAIKRGDLGQRCYRLIQCVDDPARLGVAHDFRHRSAPVGQHRRAAGHRFNHAQAERLVEADQMQQGACATQQCIALNRPDRADIAHAIAIDMWRDLLIKV